MQTSTDHGRNAGFTRVELAVILSTLALAGAVLTPVWSGAQGSPRTLICQDNFRRLAAAWTLYADDNNGRLVDNLEDAATPTAGKASWVSGWLDWTTSTANTNTAYLTDGRYSLLAAYAGRDPSIYKCAADTYLGAAQIARGWPVRVRSYSMNYYVGSKSSTSMAPGYAVYRRFSELNALTPAGLFTFVEEHPDSLNDPMFVNYPTGAMWTDLPASLHERACWFAFADGHTELHAWRSAATCVPVRVGSFGGISAPQSDPDVVWIRARSTERQ